MNTGMHYLQHWAFVVHERFHVNAMVFIALNVVCAPLFYYSIYRSLRAARARDRATLTRWSSVFLGVTVVPYAYVMAFGRNLPPWVFVAIGALVMQGVVSLALKIRRAARPPVPAVAIARSTSRSP